MFVSSQYLEEIERLGKAEGSRPHFPPWLSFLDLSLVAISSSHLSWPLSRTHPLQSVSKPTAWSCAFPSVLSKRILQFLSQMSYLVKTVRLTLLPWTTTLFFMWIFWAPHLSTFKPSERLGKTNCKEHLIFTVCIFICFYQLRVRSDLPCLLHLVLTTYQQYLKANQTHSSLITKDLFFTATSDPHGIIQQFCALD